VEIIEKLSPALRLHINDMTISAHGACDNAESMNFMMKQSKKIKIWAFNRALRCRQLEVARFLYQQIGYHFTPKYLGKDRDLISMMMKNDTVDAFTTLDCIVKGGHYNLLVEFWPKVPKSDHFERFALMFTLTHAARLEDSSILEFLLDHFRGEIIVYSAITRAISSDRYDNLKLLLKLCVKQDNLNYQHYCATVVYNVLKAGDPKVVEFTLRPEIISIVNIWIHCTWEHVLNTAADVGSVKLINFLSAKGAKYGNCSIGDEMAIKILTGYQFLNM
jgi:hypothetical protein